MNAATLDLQQWSLRRWAFSILTASLLQAGLIWMLSEPAPQPRPTLVERTALHLAADPWSLRQLLAWPGLEDPTLFSLPHQRGFSGAAWLTYTPIRYDLTNWSESPRFLQLDDGRMGGAFEALVRNRQWMPLSITDRAMPRSLIPDLTVFNLPVARESRCQVAGGLTQRRLLTRWRLPSWPRSELLTNSIVQLLVGPDGLPFSAILLQSSGWVEADQFALLSAREARFEALGPGSSSAASGQSFTSGKLVFEWHTTIPTTTNSTPVFPSPDEHGTDF